MKKTLLIIGSSGFFGRSIIDYLQNTNKYNKSFSHLCLISKKNKPRIKKRLKSKFVITQLKLDILKAKKIPDADYIVYSALSNNFKKDHLTFKNFLNLLKKNKKKCRLIYTSSGAIYLNHSDKYKSLKENDKLNNSLFNSKLKKKYIESKIKNEALIKSIKNENIKVSILRCFAFVGKYLPRNKNYFVGNIIKSIIEKKNIKILNPSKVVRSYMHADDLSDVILKILIQEKNKFSIYNIGSDDYIDVKYIAKKLAKIFNLKVKTPSLKKKINSDIYIPNIKKFRRKFSYNKKLSSYKAIIKTISEIRYKGDQKY